MRQKVATSIPLHRQDTGALINERVRESCWLDKQELCLNDKSLCPSCLFSVRAVCFHSNGVSELDDERAHVCR